MTAPGKTRQRATQQRAEQTRERILDTAVELFSTRGYDGVSVRSVELEAGIKRGLVGYHFGAKEALWKATMTHLFQQLPTLSEEAISAMQDLPGDAQFRVHVTRFIQFSASHPQVSRVIIQEGRHHSWRLEFLLENFVKPRIRWIDEASGGRLNAHSLYILIGASTLVFDVAAECESLFGIDPTTDEFVRDHARQVCDMLLGQAGAVINLNTVDA